MVNKKRFMVAVSDDAHQKMKEIQKYTERTLAWIVSRAINNYFKATVGNRIKE